MTALFVASFSILFQGLVVLFRHVLLSVHEWILWLIFIVRTYYF